MENCSLEAAFLLTGLSASLRPVKKKNVPQLSKLFLIWLSKKQLGKLWYEIIPQQKLHVYFCHSQYKLRHLLLLTPNHLWET